MAPKSSPNNSDLPVEVMIEVEPRCNFNCRFCFNRLSFAGQDRSLKPFSTGYVKKIIDNVAAAGIKVVRFTGGEPLLRPDIFTLLAYAKQKELEVRLNTNGFLLNFNNFRKLRGIVDNVLIPIESWTNKGEAEITGIKNSLKQKILATVLLARIGVPVVRVGTVATKENIHHFNKLADLILSLPISEWELYRPIIIFPERKEGISKKNLAALVGAIIDLRNKTSRLITIANAVPFCAISDPSLLNTVSCGALYEDGHSRLVVDPRGFVKPHYFMDKNIGRPTDILSAWNHPFMRKMRNLAFLPQECRDCSFQFKCRGGSRFAAKVAAGDYAALDPLADIKRVLCQ